MGIIQEFSISSRLRKTGIIYCVIIMFLVALGGLAVLGVYGVINMNGSLNLEYGILPFLIAGILVLLSLPVPSISLIMFVLSKNNRLLHIHGMWLIVFYTISALVLSYLIPHWAENQPMGGILYLLAPLYVQFWCTISFAVFFVIYYIVRVYKKSQS